MSAVIHMTAPFFADFSPFRITTSGATIYGVIGGPARRCCCCRAGRRRISSGGSSRPDWPKQFTVVATDLRGYGDSSKPPDGDNHVGLLKTRDGAGSDRGHGTARLRADSRSSATTAAGGSRIAWRSTTRARHARCAARYRADAHGIQHSHQGARHSLLPLVLSDSTRAAAGNAARGQRRNFPAQLSPSGISFPPSSPKHVFAEYLRCFSDPATLHAMCEDYRAAASIDLEHDKVDLTRKIDCPVLVLWGERGAMHPLYDVCADLARARHICTRRGPARRTLVAGRVSGRSVRGFAGFPERPYILVTPPGRAAAVARPQDASSGLRIVRVFVTLRHLLPSGTFAMHSLNARFVAGLLLATTCSLPSP